VIVLDGGMGTLLQAKGLQPGETPEDWNVEHPDDVTAVHRAYVEAGSQVVYANTFGANPLKYHGKYSLEEVISAGIANARKAGEVVVKSCSCRKELSPSVEKDKPSVLQLQLSTTTQRIRVALDIGPTGKLLKPAGDLSFEDAVVAFKETIRIATTVVEGQRTEDGGQTAAPDLIVIETMSDLREVKAAVIAAKETCDLPIYVTVTLGEDGRLLTGASVEAVSALLESLDVAAYGFNCGLGPDRMLPHVKRLAQLSTKSIIVKPNAGLPSVVDGKTVFSVGPDEFAADVKKLIDAGASIVGGCCGTTPEHIGEVVKQRRSGVLAASEIRTDRLLSKAAGTPLLHLEAERIPLLRSATIVSSGTTVIELKPHEGLVIGERINPTGKKALKEAYAKGDTAFVLREAVKQVEAGAEILDVNCGVPGLDEAALLEATVENVQSVVTCPLQIDTADPAALERGLRAVNGKALVNSVNGKRASMDAVFPLVKKYGGTIVALCLDESGIPSTSEGRLAIARRILDEGAKYGFSKEDFVFDALTLSVSADPQAAVVTLETVRRLTEELGVNTVLGVSNVSFGLPNRPVLNNTMYALAKRAGLSAAIANPSLIRDEIDPAAEDVLLGRDRNCERWIAGQSGKGEAASSPLQNKDGQFMTSGGDAASPFKSSPLLSAIRRGLKEDARASAKEMLAAGKSAMDVIQEGIVPALEEVGRGFEKGTVYLPQLLMAADAAGEAFAVVKDKGLGQRTEDKGQRNESTAVNLNLQPQHLSHPIVLATVKGDIHDIGKNIVRALLENYGFEVIDLGRDVPSEKIVETARQTNAMMVGLSALMTTTVGAMAETIRQLKASGLTCKTCVGGAVVTQEYADSIGADFYAKDAMRTVRFAESLMVKMV